MAKKGAEGSVKVAPLRSCKRIKTTRSTRIFNLEDNEEEMRDAIIGFRRKAENKKMTKGFRRNSTRIHSLEDEGQETGGTHFGIRRKGGTVDDPISVEQLQLPQLGSSKNPISLEGEVKMVGSIQPISVEDDDNDEAVTFKIAVAESHGDVESSSEVQVFDCDPDDPKGKKPVKSRTLRRAGGARAVEVGQSSNSPPALPNIKCSICTESKFGFEIFFILGCSHFYCSSCVSQYVKAKVEDNVTQIGCPDPSCKDGLLEPEACRLILAPEVFARWGAAMCESLIDESTKFYCPYKDCSALLIAEEDNDGDVLTMSECPHCSRMFCAQCKVPWHNKISCKEFQALGDDERGKEDLMLRKVAKACKWQRCSKCKIYVEKVTGCVYMKCRCGHTFCYICAEPLGRTHYCSKCKRTW